MTDSSAPSPASSTDSGSGSATTSATTSASGSASGFEPANPALFFTRNDASDPRLGEFVQQLAGPITSQMIAQITAQAEGRTTGQVTGQTPGHLAGLSKDLAGAWSGANILAGYPDDEGIQTNGGRTGAAKAPDAVRKYLYKMTPPLLGAAMRQAAQPADSKAENSKKISILDFGNLINKGDLLNKHEVAFVAAKAALNAGARWVTVGGGHDYGFPDAAAYIEWAHDRGERPLIINFDAHLDVRSTARGLSSGTPFFRMLEKYPNVDFAEIGIQTQCNSRAHLEWVTARGARVITQEEVLVSGQSFTTQVLNLLGDWLLKRRSVFLSVDIDGFNSMAAPGCSQSWSTGFSPQDFFSTLTVLQARLDIRALGIYEVSPPLDRDDQTSKLAAQIIHRVVGQ